MALSVALDTPLEDITDEKAGQWITVTITLDSSDGEVDGNTTYDCKSDDGIHRTVHFKGIVNLNETVPHVVTGRLRVIYHPAAVIDEVVFDGFTEYRLEKVVKAQ